MSILFFHILACNLKFNNPKRNQDKRKCIKTLTKSAYFIFLETNLILKFYNSNNHK